MLKKMTLRQKIVALGVLQLVFVTGVLFYLNYRQTRQTAENEYVARARSIALTAESVREEMGRKWNLGLFDKKMLSQWAKEGTLGPGPGGRARGHCLAIGPGQGQGRRLRVPRAEVPAAQSQERARRPWKPGP